MNVGLNHSVRNQDDTRIKSTGACSSNKGRFETGQKVQQTKKNKKTDWKPVDKVYNVWKGASLMLWTMCGMWTQHAKNGNNLQKNRTKVWTKKSFMGTIIYQRANMQKWRHLAYWVCQLSQMGRSAIQLFALGNPREGGSDKGEKHFCVCLCQPNQHCNRKYLFCDIVSS